ncbi:MAG: hypothetical protein K1X75_07475 [Leptospirales bacterium]|nr:hypothetical protein [Leptospirales bacterium]
MSLGFALLALFFTLSCEAGRFECQASDPQCNPLAGYLLYSSALLQVDWLVVVGDSGTVLYSSDLGASWSAGVSGTTANLRGVRYAGGNRWVAVGDADTMLYSDNGGMSWTPAAQPSTGSCNHQMLAYGNGILLSVGTVGNIFRSLDGGVNWVSTTTPIAPVKNQADYLCGVFVHASNASIAFSADGTGSVSAATNPTFPAGRGACAGTRMVIGSGAAPFNHYSMDGGNNWIAGGAGISAIRRMVRLVGSTLVALGDDLTSQTSSDATAWNAAGALPVGFLKDAATLDATHLIAVGGTGATPSMVRTDNTASSWTQVSGLPAVILNGIAYGRILKPR